MFLDVQAIKVLRAIACYVPAALAPPPELVCSDRGFANQRADLAGSPWLGRMLFGGRIGFGSRRAAGPADAPQDVGVRFAAGTPALLREVATRRLPRPLLGPVYR
jgi:DNA helicase INO80